jgi:hypothetical protein
VASEAAQAALAAVQRVNAMLSAKVSNDAAPAPIEATPAPAAPPVDERAVRTMNRDCQYEAGEYIQLVDINDSKNRYQLTRTEMQKQLMRDTSAILMTRGKYYPDRRMSSLDEPPLHLRISSKHKEVVDNAYKKIKEILDAEFNIEFRAGNREIKVPVGIDINTPFPLRGKIVGPMGANMKHIQQTTNSRVQLRGIGSGYREQLTNEEANEPMFISISYVLDAL